jgi:hypothetical protein
MLQTVQPFDHGQYLASNAAAMIVMNDSVSASVQDAQ